MAQEAILILCLCVSFLQVLQPLQFYEPLYKTTMEFISSDVYILQNVPEMLKLEFKANSLMKLLKLKVGPSINLQVIHLSFLSFLLLHLSDEREIAEGSKEREKVPN